MKIKCIRWRNIFSYGNKEEVINFSDEGALWQLSGISGAGKSSLLSIPKLLLYGKTEDDKGKPISVNEISNWVNGKGWIQGEIESDNDLYVVERTFSPSSLIVYKNGEQIDRAGKKDMQNIIDTEILKGMSYHIFTNLMTLSLNGGKSFISMTPSDKREIIDKIFSLEIINKVYEYIKRDKKEIGNAINIANSQINTINSNIKLSEQKLVDLKTQVETFNAEKISELEKSIKEYNERLLKLDNLYKEQVEQKQNAEKKSKDAYVAVQNAYADVFQNKMNVNSIEEKIKLFSQSKCPTCGTPFTGDSFDMLRESLQIELINANQKRDDSEKFYNDLVQYKADIDTIISNFSNNINKINDKKINLEKEKQSVVTSLNHINQNMKGGLEYNAIEQIIEENKKTKKEVESDIINSNSKMSILDIMDKLYSSDGIKRIMMQDNLPLLNADIAKTLQDIHFPYQLEFDDNFDSHIKYLGKDVKAPNLSTGEHKKIDAAVVCALLMFLKRRYPQVNLVCLDETVSSLDYESSSNVIAKLKELAKEMNIHIFIVSHTQLNESLFDKKITVTKNSGFSEITIN